MHWPPALIATRVRKKQKGIILFRSSWRGFGPHATRRDRPPCGLAHPTTLLLVPGLPRRPLVLLSASEPKNRVAYSPLFFEGGQQRCVRLREIEVRFGKLRDDNVEGSH
jgi:hypothetical protein